MTARREQGGLHELETIYQFAPKPSERTGDMPPITEREFQRQVLDLAGILGWTCYHPMLSKWSERGYPDLTLIRPPRLVFAELKRQTGKTSEHQDRWLGLLAACPGVETYLWRPDDLARIAEVLR